VGILAKTYCLASVNASFYQIARGLLLPFTLLLSYLILRPRPTNPPLSLAGCGVIMLGFATGMVTDLQKMLTSYKGMALGVGSSFTTAVESVVVKKFLGKGDEGMWQLVWMSSFMQLGLYVPLLFFSGELNTLSTTAPDVFGQFIRTAILTGLASFLLTLATFLQISVTSPTTHMIVTAARGVAQSALAVMILGESLTAGRVWSMACILGGSTIYGIGKDRLREKKENERGGYQAVPAAERDVELGEKNSK
jgi:GDP-fucose transporter C1